MEKLDEIDYNRSYIVLNFLINGFIAIFGLTTLAAGVVVGHLFHNGENELMFIPLAAGFVSLCVTYFFVEAKNLLIHGNKVEGF